MALDLAHYVGQGREQAYVKHYFLAEYLERLIFKIASRYSEIVYVDGFSGPWQDHGQQFEDTSFGIALKALSLARRTWAEMPQRQRRQVRMIAHLVERHPAAFARLAALQTLFPEVEVVTHQGDFTDLAPRIAAGLPVRAFAFVLIDPKGWKVDLEAIEPLIGRENCEVVFNFMFDFINRFALYDDPAISGQLDRLIPQADWRSRVRQADAAEDALTSHPVPDARKRAIVESFAEALGRVGRYRFVADVDVLRPVRDRTLYFLVYGTRQAKGIEVFRDCHVDALQRQSEMRGRIKIERQQVKSGQLELLASANEMGPDRLSISLPAEHQRARDILLEMVPKTGEGVRWDSLWPVILSRCVIRLKDLKQIAGEWRRRGVLKFPAWPSNVKRTPEDEYLVLRGDQKS